MRFAGRKDLTEANETVAQIHHVALIRPEPISCADHLAHVVFERQDVGTMGRFLADFGLVTLGGETEVRYYRGSGPMPYLVAVIPSVQNRFAGFGIHARSASDLQKLSDAT